MPAGLSLRKTALYYTRPATSDSGGLLSQKSCHNLNQSRTLNNILMRAAHWMAYFDLRKLNLVKDNVLEAFESYLQW